MYELAVVYEGNILLVNLFKNPNLMISVSIGLYLHCFELLIYNLITSIYFINYTCYNILPIKIILRSEPIFTLSTANVDISDVYFLYISGKLIYISLIQATST